MVAREIGKLCEDAHARANRMIGTDTGGLISYMVTVRTIVTVSLSCATLSHRGSVVTLDM